MSEFAIAAGLMTVIHLVAAWQRPRLAVIVSGMLWLLYAGYEYLVASGVLCDANCKERRRFAYGGKGRTDVRRATPVKRSRGPPHACGVYFL